MFAIFLFHKRSFGMYQYAFCGYRSGRSHERERDMNITSNSLKVLYNIICSGQLKFLKYDTLDHY